MDGLMMKQAIRLFIQLVLLPIIANCAGIPYGNRQHFIESPQLSKWGEWGKLEHCPSDQVVVGMKLKVHEYQGVKDDSGLNAVKFYCQNPYSSSEYADDLVGITSLVGDFGVWKQDFFCPAAAAESSENKLIAVGFQLRSESSSGVKDDTAGNNLKLVCSDLYQKQGYTYLEGDGTQKGQWTDRQLCWPGYAICGLQTQVEMSRSIDTTGLNNMKVRCCKIDSGYNFEKALSTNLSHVSHDSRDSSSSSENSAESSSSGEKDGGNQGALNHHNHRGDHSTSVEDVEGTGSSKFEESQQSPDEQELIAIVNPEPAQEQEIINESPSLSNQNSTDEVEQAPPQLPSSSSVENEQHSTSNEDDHLPEEIAQIDQVDNSEARQEEEENVSTVTDAQQHSIPEDVVNALEDADSDDSSSNQNDDHPSQPFNDKPFHWGTEMTNLTGLNEVTGISDHEEGTNSLDEEPKSSPRFGQVGENSTLAVSSHASQFFRNWNCIGSGSMLFLYSIKLLF